MKAAKTTNVDLEPNPQVNSTVYLEFIGFWGLTMLIDINVQHNLLDPEMMRYVALNDDKPDEIVHHYEGQEQVICKDGVERTYDMVRLNFHLDFKEKCSEVFVLDPSVNHYLSKVEIDIAGVLGADFIEKHKLDLGDLRKIISE